MSNSFYKPVVGAALVVAGDNLILQNRNMNSSLALGAAAGTAFYFSKNIAKLLPNQTGGNNAMYDVKTLETRLGEIGIASIGGYALNKFVLNNDMQTNDMLQKIGLIVAADFVSEYVDDYMSNRELAFFK
jgi:hypothetical protein